MGAAKSPASRDPQADLVHVPHPVTEAGWQLMVWADSDIARPGEFAAFGPYGTVREAVVDAEQRAAAIERERLKDEIVDALLQGSEPLSAATLTAIGGMRVLCGWCLEQVRTAA